MRRKSIAYLNVNKRKRRNSPQMTRVMNGRTAKTKGCETSVISSSHSFLQVVLGSDGNERGKATSEFVSIVLSICRGYGTRENWEEQKSRG